ncbi:peptidoglycan DD-metalloendopeptidase family protein [Candidatus Promineifilum breve]|uniref:peptidoglycan DD-metalloendopeptidase family protein n=1 Tax=Candidatus Promineifilum breve TaxID=1806508 RepID=UPI001E42D220|nr:peptidoglycan DD-metalloendopeptidase family protein [Candidatus Promineifilum breve]
MSCGGRTPPAADPPPTAVSPSPTAESRTPTPDSPPPTTESLPPTADSPPPTADSPPPTPDSPPPTALTTPTVDPAIGLPCAATPPVKPDYAAYSLSAAPWPTPDPAAAPPPLALIDPLPGSERNEGYPYGSDGSGRYLLHNGLDMADEAGTAAVAPFAGEVILARDDLDEHFGWRCDWYGQLVVIRAEQLHDGQPVYALFGHVADVAVSEGQHVAAGQPVARQGTAGAAVVPHVHLEVRVGANAFGATRNPVLWLAPPEGQGVIAGRLVDPEGRAWQGVTVTLIDPSGAPPYRTTWTYLDDPDHSIRPDPALGENFVFGPVAAGTYEVYTQVQGVEHRQPVEVVAGTLSTIEIITEPYQTSTP